MLTTIYKNEQGVIDKVVLVAQSPEEAKWLIDVAAQYEAPGSGSERWPNTGWTEAGDGTGYPGVPTQAQADEAAKE